jgi:hypothetical protein
LIRHMEILVLDRPLLTGLETKFVKP